MQEYVSHGELLPLCREINEVKHVLCIGYSIYMLHMQVLGGSYTTVQDHTCKEVNTDGALQGTGPL